jgi:hypothetical protein
MVHLGGRVLRVLCIREDQKRTILVYPDPLYVNSLAVLHFPSLNGPEAGPSSDEIK